MAASGFGPRDTRCLRVALKSSHSTSLPCARRVRRSWWNSHRCCAFSSNSTSPMSKKMILTMMAFCTTARPCSPLCSLRPSTGYTGRSQRFHRRHPMAMATQTDTGAGRTGQITFKGGPLTLLGKELKVGDRVPDFGVQAAGTLETVGWDQLSEGGTKAVLMILVPSIDTSVCSLETGKFNRQVASLPADKIKTVSVSADTPFAQDRWAKAEGVTNIQMLSPTTRTGPSARRSASRSKRWGCWRGPSTSWTSPGSSATSRPCRRSRPNRTMMRSCPAARAGRGGVGDEKQRVAEATRFSVLVPKCWTFTGLIIFCDCGGRCTSRRSASSLTTRNNPLKRRRGRI